MTISVLIEVNVTVENLEEAQDIADDLHKILNNCEITNSVMVVDDVLC